MRSAFDAKGTTLVRTGAMGAGGTATVTSSATDFGADRSPQEITTTTTTTTAVTSLGSVVIPAHVPNVYGGAALGIWEWGKNVNGHWLPGSTGMIFAFSGADGPSDEGSDFTGLLTPKRFGVNFFMQGNTTLTLGPDQPEVAVASSDVLVVGDAAQPTIVLAYAAWNVLVGYAPEAALTAKLDPMLPVPVPPPPAGCSITGQVMAICKGANSTFAVAFAEGGGVAALAAAALAAHPTTSAIDAVATARLAPLGKLPAPAMATRGNSSTDLAKLSSKVFSVMRVNTLAPEGDCATHWSTPDKVPHKAAWLWDSCFHAIGRQVVEPELAWEFLHVMLASAAADGHVPIRSDPWTMKPWTGADTQPPNLCLATKFVLNAGGLNTSQLLWALPRLERYIEWDFANRDPDHDGLLNWHDGSESGQDNSPLYDSPHSAVSSYDSTEFSSYAALEMGYLAEFHTLLGNVSGAAHWAARANATAQAIHSHLWDAEDKFYYYRDGNTTAGVAAGDFVRVQTLSGFAPLLLPGVPDERVAALIRHLNDPKKFASKKPLPTVAMDYVTKECPANSTNMWRRPTWTNTNLYTIWGLRNYGHVAGALELADKLQQATVEMVGESYQKHGTTFEFYDSAGRVEPTVLQRKEEKRSGGVRDYHWTAANVFYLLHTPNATLP